MSKAPQHPIGRSATTDALAPPVSTPSAAGSVSAEVVLESLAPRFDEEQHGTYLKRLEQAVEDPKNVNIALTGRYGSGKSSVLEKFVESHTSTTLRLAISTLGPNDEGATLTNRIQKELVKQLVYSASPRTLRHSRFSRSIPLSRRRAFGEAVAAVGGLVLLLALLGWLPPVTGTGSGNHWLVRATAWTSLAALLVVIAAVARLLTHDRFVLSDVSAGGGTVRLSERTPTYFDEYLNDIVNYFDSEGVDFVILEDLDRFDDPQIFEALRWLNTLLNNTQKRVQKNVPLRFVYAVRDSLFEKLGADTRAESDDAAAAETVRANRTKFFDVVIPLVPFISHRNARELLTELLESARITDIDRRLVNLIAQHCTDMRLLRNMRNEYLVFAERLLESGKVAPGLAPSNLFALVAYKNFHLEDFEQIARRGSKLDTLYRYQRNLVRRSVQEREQRKRDLIADRARERARAPLARRLAERLLVVGELTKAKTGYAQYRHLYFSVGDTNFPSDSLSAYAFWAALAQADAIQVHASSAPEGGGIPVFALTRDQLTKLVPEAFDAARWKGIDADAVNSELAQIDRDIDFLRGADFAELAANIKFKLSVVASEPSTLTAAAETAGESVAREGAAATVQVDRTFAELVDDTLESDLARDLVKRGYIDRNFALYAAQFYGHFTGVDVATFIVQSVQSNMMDIDYRFSSPGAVTNLLDETDEDFTHTAAAYNIAVLDHLLDNGDPRVADIVDHMVSTFDEDAQTFLAAYLTWGRQRNRLAALLAAHPWRTVFTHLVTDVNVPADARVGLVDAALVAADGDLPYDLTDEVCDFIVDNYREMSAFTQPHDNATTGAVAAMLERLEVRIPDLTALDQGLQLLVIGRNLYQLSALNLRVALGTTGAVTLDQVRGDRTVYEYCLARPGEYLAAVEQDVETPHTVRTSQTLAEVLSDVAGASAWAAGWGEPEIRRVVSGAASETVLPRITAVPATTWPALAEAKLFAPSLTNLEAYRAEIGEIDEHLAALLLDAGAIDTGAGAEDESTRELDEEGEKQEAAVALLNARTIPAPVERVALVRSLCLNEPLPLTDINAEASDLFALLLEHKLVADNAASFTHFHEAGWAAIGPAIAASSNVSDFLTPELVEGMVAELLTDPATRDKLGQAVVEEVEEFVPDEDGLALQAVIQYAAEHGMSLTPRTVVRAARAGPTNHNLVLRLLRAASPAASAQHIVDVFVALGKPYSEVTRTGAKFDVDYDELHESLLKTLQDAHICTFGKKRGRDCYTVRVI